jgi:aminoglycoside N3'-acetyltransferase
VIKKTSLNDINKHLDKLNIVENDNVIIHSSLFAFGIIDFSMSDLVKILLNRISPNGVLSVPTYTFNCSLEKYYDADNTLCSNVGVLSEHICKMPKRLRSMSPIHNHCFLGNIKYEYAMSTPYNSLGRGTDFELFYKYDYKLLLLGTDFQNGCTYLHHLEALAKVPYRKWIKVKRKIKENKKKNFKIVGTNYYALKGNNYIEDFNKVIKLFNESELITVSTHYGTSYSLHIRSLHRKIFDKLNKNKYFLVKK